MKIRDDKNLSINKISKDRVSDKWAKSDQVYTQNKFKVYWELADIAARYQWSKMTGEKELYKCKDLLEYIASFFPKNKQLKDMVALVSKYQCF